MKTLHGHVFKRGMLIAVVLVVCLTLVWLSSGAASTSHASGNAYVRVNQVGYLKSETKQAILMASGSESGATLSMSLAAGSMPETISSLSRRPAIPMPSCSSQIASTPRCLTAARRISVARASMD